MNYLATIILLHFSSVIFSQQITSFNLNEIIITDKANGSSIKNTTAVFNKQQIISAFGQPDSIQTEMVEAVGGLIDKYYYGMNYFFIPADEYASSGFQIVTNRFSVVLKDTVSITVGTDSKQLLQIIDSNQHYENREFYSRNEEVSMVNGFYLYGYNEEYPDSFGTAFLDVAYDPQTFKILRINYYPRS